VLRHKISPKVEDHSIIKTIDHVRKFPLEKHVSAIKIAQERKLVHIRVEKSTKLSIRGEDGIDKIKSTPRFSCEPLISVLAGGLPNDFTREKAIWKFL